MSAVVLALPFVFGVAYLLGILVVRLGLWDLIGDTFDAIALAVSDAGFWVRCRVKRLDARSERAKWLGRDSAFLPLNVLFSTASASVEKASSRTSASNASSPSWAGSTPERTRTQEGPGAPRPRELRRALRVPQSSQPLRYAGRSRAGLERLLRLSRSRSRSTADLLPRSADSGPEALPECRAPSH